MKSRIKEQGSAVHIVIIVVLIIAVLGLLGFVFWQNFMNKTPASIDNSQTTNNTDSTSKTADLTLSELGIKVAYDPSKDTYTAEWNSEFEIYRIYSKNATAACGNAEDIGYMQSWVADEVREEGAPGEGQTNAEIIKSSEFYRAVTKDDGNIYVYGSPQNACVDTSTEEGMTNAGIAEDAYKTLADDFENLELL